MGCAVVSPGTLYVVATPLGNLGDVSERSRTVLTLVDWVAAEDTRRARTLLAHLHARPRLLSFHAHSPRTRLERILGALAAGESVAVVTDAGTPTISDPGAELIRHARARDIPVVSVPGPSAVTAALSISGMPADRYIFVGFLPRKGRERRDLLSRVAASPWTVVIFESARRVVALLAELDTVCGGERTAAVARELTKVHEEVRVGTLRELGVYYREHPPRGEITLLVAGGGVVPGSAPAVDPRDRAQALLAAGNSRRDVANHLARELKLARNEAYRIVNAL
ncbi:MAG: 16S rRNA (cytidine(1402)-2'-O)-methyltransferase [Gemmatimonadetes bacterium]|nr:16S rRNA (cytidine(1402)-2'-O)-methyltransferase [Gemmatimonadota bacterium]